MELPLRLRTAIRALRIMTAEGPDFGADDRMTLHDFAALENAEFEASIDLDRAAPEDLRVAHAIEVCDIGAATCMSCRGIGR